MRFSVPIVVTVFTTLFLLERIFPLRQPRRELGNRIPVNVCLSILTFAVTYWFVKPTALSVMEWTSQTSFGLLPKLNLCPLVQLITTFLLLDLTFYYWHRLNHSFTLLWRFHNVHHIDPDLDVFTGFRFHFGEVAFSAIFRIVQVMLIGPALSAFLIYELFFQISTYFHHSNLRLPFRLEKFLNFVIVTPRMHGIHHSQIHEETDANYSVIFSFWDRVHGSLCLRSDHSMPKIGVPAYDEPEANNIFNVLLVPFHKQRDYWGRSQKV